MEQVPVYRSKTGLRRDPRSDVILRREIRELPLERLVSVHLPFGPRGSTVSGRQSTLSVVDTVSLLPASLVTLVTMLPCTLTVAPPLVESVLIFCSAADSHA